MDLVSGHPYFLLKNGLGQNFEMLRSNLVTDVVILGGGISGALMAHALVKNGTDCVIIDKRSIGLGSTSASTSLLQYEIDIPLHQLVKKIGKQEAISAYKLCSAAIDQIQAIAKEIGYKNFQTCNSLYFSHETKCTSFLEKEFKIREEAGFDVYYLNEKQISERYGFKSKEAILSTKAAKIDAYAFSRHLNQYNTKKGLRVFEKTEATKIIESPEGIELWTQNGHMLKAKKIVYATGYEVTEQISKSIVNLQSTYALVTDPVERLPSFFEHTLLWNTSDPYLYMREDNGRLIVGGRDENFKSPAKRDALLQMKVKGLEEDLFKLFPEIKTKTQFAWTGTFGTTKDGLPYIGTYSKKPNSYFALGFGGNGITFSAIAANLITNMITTEGSTVPKMFSFNR